MRIGKNGVCSVCGKPIGAGVATEFAHGKCNETLAELEHSEVVVVGNQRRNLEVHKHNRDVQAKRQYLTGRLPSWMLGK